MKQDASIGTNILRVSASDEDADNNGAIVYSLTAPNSLDLEYFEIQPESGWIVLKKPLDVSFDPGVMSIVSFVCLIDHVGMPGDERLLEPSLTILYGFK